MLSINAVYDQSGTIACYVAIFLDISDLKNIQNKLVQLPFYDALTGLPNRLYFIDQLERSVTMAKCQNTELALIVINLDRFKRINEDLGYLAGDTLLRDVSIRLKSCIGQGKTIARFGNDEFGVVLNSVENSDIASQYAKILLESFKGHFEIDDQKYYMGISIGIALFPRDTDDHEELIKHAVTAMHIAKKAGRNTFRFFSELNKKKSDKLIFIEENLYQALEKNQLIPYYQPKLDLTSNKLSGAEVLVRWIKPDGTLVSPGVFIPLAEETGLILPLGDRILRLACLYTSFITNKNTDKFKIAVNLSSREFLQSGVVTRIVSALEEAELSPDRLEIEITESMIMGNMEDAIKIMKLLRVLGVSIAIDDFGTGYSSLSYLKKFPINTLKIDQSFIRSLPDSVEDSAIVRAVISMAHCLSLKVVAEGVETQMQKKFLQSLGCDIVQGFLYGKPMPKEQFTKFFNGQKS
jgi:diguanylate cyclase (GGDEF)-like protein